MTHHVPAELQNYVRQSIIPVSYTHLDVYKRQAGTRTTVIPAAAAASKSTLLNPAHRSEIGRAHV